MLRQRLKTIVLVFAIVVVLVVVLLMGFRIGYAFIQNQNQRQLAIDAVKIQDQKNAEAMSTDEAGNPIKEVRATYENGEPIPIPRHIKVDTPGAIQVYIEYGWGTKEIAQALIDKGIIEDAAPFTVMAKINGFDGRYQQGTHFVLDGMDYNEIMYNLSLPAERTTITFIEGSSYIDIKAELKASGVNFDEKKMDEVVNNPSLFKHYSFITNVPTDIKGRFYSLEGYLFPDTYSFDLNADEEEIIATFLSNTEAKFTKEIRDRAEAIGMSLDEVLNLAALIQNEAGNVEEMYKISRVFHNRLENSDLMQSCATANYLRKINGKPRVWYATNEDVKIENPYNSYKYPGLPIGPIGNPGLEAVRAALYPDTEDTKLYYFVAKGDGTSVFTSDPEEHFANIEKYKEYWTMERE